MNKHFFEIEFNASFFEKLKLQWLKTKEVYLLLQAIPELLMNGDITLTTTPDVNNYYIYKESSYYFIKLITLQQWLRHFKYEKESTTNLRVDGVDMIRCYYSSSPHLPQRRMYHLINGSEFCFVHILKVNNNNKHYNGLSSNNTNDSGCPLLKIIDFSPENVIEMTQEQKMLIVIQSDIFDVKELQKYIQNIQVSFGAVSVKCNAIAHNVIACVIPPQTEKEVIIELYTTNNSHKKVSYYDNNNIKCFKYITASCDIIHHQQHQHQHQQLQCNKHMHYYKQKSKIKCKIFKYTNDKIESNIIQLLKEINKQIDFYSRTVNCKQSPSLDISSILTTFNEDNLNKSITLLYNELQSINKLYLMNFFDNDGYNLVHYACAINYSNTLQLLNHYKLNIETKTKDDLSCYEICAGKRNLESLTTLIDIADSIKNDTNNNEIEPKGKFLNDVEILKSALNILLSRKKGDINDIKVLDLLINQIKIKYTIDMTSMTILNDFQSSNGDCNQLDIDEEEMMYKTDNVMKIQRSVRGWLRRNKYKNLTKEAYYLIEKLKGCCQNKEYLDIRQSIILIQHSIRSLLLKKKHKSE